MAISYQRSWWKPWQWPTRTWVLLMVVAIFISPLFLRWLCLWQVPDVSLPFDVQQVIVKRDPMTPDAFDVYAKAILLKPQVSREEWALMLAAIDSVDTKWDDQLDQWLVDNQKLLAEYLNATEIERAIGPSLETVDITTGLAVHQECRSLLRFSELQAASFERVGKVDQAWIWHRANLRCSIHVEKPGILICRLIGISIRNETCRGIARWAQNASVTSEQLRAARREISAVAAKRMPYSDVLKGEYLTLRNTLRRPDYAGLIVSELQLGIWEDYVLGFRSAVGDRTALGIANIGFWLFGQPELRLRLDRQMLANNADQLDLPLYLRRKTVSTYAPLVFELDGRTKLPGQLDPAQLASLCSLTRISLENNHGSFGAQRNFDQALHMDDSRLAALNVVLAAHEYQRSHGEFPATVQQLVPEFLDSIPFDPMDATGASLRYRREENGEALVWSIGLDGQDDNGHLDTERPKDAGYRIRLSK